MKSLFLFLIISTFISCCSHQDKSLFYVIKEVKLTKHDSIGYIGPVFYSTSNFILYNDSTIYFHKKNTGNFGICGTGLDLSKPPFLDLQPSQLIEIQLDELDLFWEKHIAASGKMDRHVTISSPTDTIYNSAIVKLKKLSDFSKKTLLNIRKCTEEQYFVSNAKFNNKSYSALKEKWVIGFDYGDSPTIQKILKFVPHEEFE